MTKPIRGTVHGKTVQLYDDPGLGDGVEVDVVLHPKSNQPWGQGIRRSAGAWANIPGIDDAMEQVREQRAEAEYRDEPA